MNSTSPIPEEKSAQKQQLHWLSMPGNLDRRLDRLDSERATRRIYVMGCGRSGTWLLAAVMSTFEEVSLIPKELPVEYFGITKTTKPVLVLKRDWNAYKRIAHIPPRVGIVYIIRHPYDVLTSHNPVTGDRFHISPKRWVGEMVALRAILRERPQGAKVIRYEDLVADPGRWQREIGAFFHLTPSVAPGDFTKTFNASPEAEKAMHGLRTIDRLSVGRYRTNPEQVAYIRAVREQLGDHLDWVGRSFGYDVSA